ncbi:hypothetical protein [Saccharothrix lopnurensis]|uniref:Uncharacterized protein n=1 Tax=Saccharothrix lopnurensis TaxID=1670621 RepID=A0ABW1P937_9PSEU
MLKDHAGMNPPGWSLRFGGNHGDHGHRRELMLIFGFASVLNLVFRPGASVRVAPLVVRAASLSPLGVLPGIRNLVGVNEGEWKAVYIVVHF